MNFIDKVFPTIILLMVLSVPFLMYNQIKRTDECKLAGGVLVKSSEGYTCVALKRIEEK